MIRNDAQITEAIIGASIAVHKALGPGLLESAYEACLEFEMRDRGLQVERQVPLPVIYQSTRVECGYRIDLLVDQKIILEIKAVDKLLPIHEAQMITYLKLSGKQLGLLLNFNVQLLKDGIKRVVLQYPT